MKLQKPLVIAVSVCLMAFFNVSSFAAEAKNNAGADPLRAKIAAQVLETEGYAAVSRGNVLELETDDGVLAVDLSEGQVSPVTLDGTPVESMDAGDLLNLSNCLLAADVIEAARDTVCELHVTDLGDLVCKTEVALDTVMNDIYCLVQYVQATSE